MRPEVREWLYPTRNRTPARTTLQLKDVDGTVRLVIGPTTPQDAADTWNLLLPLSGRVSL